MSEKKKKRDLTIDRNSNFIPSKKSKPSNQVVSPSSVGRIIELTHEPTSFTFKCTECCEEKDHDLLAWRCAQGERQIEGYEDIEVCGREVCDLCTENEFPLQCVTCNRLYCCESLPFFCRGCDAFVCDFCYCSHKMLEEHLCDYKCHVHEALKDEFQSG